MKKKRSAKQIRADISRITLEGKTLRQQMKIIARQYSKLGRAIPKKIIEGRANKRDIRNYMSTLINVLDKKIERQNLREDKEFIKTLDELNSIQHLRHKLMSNELQGYDKQFINEFLGGKVAILGRNSTASVVSTNRYDMNRIIRLAELNNVSPIDFMKDEIKSLKKDLEDFKRDNPKEYILDQIKQITSQAGFTLTDKNIKDINSRLNKIDWLGGVRIIKAMEYRIENYIYEVYKGVWSNNDNRILMETILEDIKRGSHQNMIQHVRLID